MCWGIFYVGFTEEGYIMLRLKLHLDGTLKQFTDDKEFGFTPTSLNLMTGDHAYAYEQILISFLKPFGNLINLKGTMCEKCR